MSCGHRGHTLFEILLALGLSLALLVAVYQALDLNARYSAAGQETMERLQLTRALLEKLRLDIRSVAGRYPEAETAAHGSGTGTQAPSAETPQRIDPFGLVGDSQRLHLQVDRPSREQLCSSGDPEHVTLPSDLQPRLVAWYVLDGPNRSPAPQRSDDDARAAAARRKANGLMRVEAALGVDSPSSSDAGSPTAETDAEPLAEEVRSIRFRYFDGVAWHEAWDSAAREALPRAVEVTLQFRGRNNYGIDPTAGEPRQTYRVVIAVPQAEPIPLGG